MNASPASNQTGYRSFQLGSFSFSRDEYFARLSWQVNGRKLSHTLSADAFLRAMMRDVAWGFFYGWVNFDPVIGTRNRYGKVEFYAGAYPSGIQGQGPGQTHSRAPH